MRRRVRGQAGGRKRFQSTPPVSRRRCGVSPPTVNDWVKFQSTPPVSRRRCVAQRIPTGTFGVSIHASCFQKAMHFVAITDLPVYGVSIHASCFQKAMPLALATAIAIPAVSIHASCFQKAMRRIYAWQTSINCFNPRLLFPEGDACTSPSCPCRSYSFQSTPPVSRRRCSHQPEQRHDPPRFNPRLLFPEGDAMDEIEKKGATQCFNPRLLFPEGDACALG